MVRIYWNVSSDPDGLIWSVDDGDQKNEVKVKKIISHRITLESNEDLTAQWPNPKGWLFSNDAKYWVSPTTQIAHLYTGLLPTYFV